MSAPWSQQWFDDCQIFYHRLLSGTYSHWCSWCGPFLVPMDETCPEFQFCKCFRCKCGDLMRPKWYPWGRRPIELHDDWFICPKMRWWNFWKHPYRDKSDRMWKI